jgi:2-polyprenyl-3-methyl-5-hydroxy-6-metoxy-1,4-benzoquinol methylase
MLNYLKKRLRRTLGIEQNEQVLEQALSKIAFFSAYFHLTQAEVLSLSPAILQEVEKGIHQNFGLEGFSTRVHKNDLMFADHILHHRNDPFQAVQSYFTLGAHTATNLSALLREKQLSPQHILDFGSGYGRISRFFPAVFPKAAITVSEVKEQAMDFQQHHLGFNTIRHTQQPQRFETSQKFDLIFALSVFTHLSAQYFKDWIQQLSNCLTDNGILVFTFNELTEPAHLEQSDGAFHYLNHSEDTTFSFVADRLTDTTEYGSTFVSRSFLQSLFAPTQFTLHFVGKTIVRNQEAVLVQRLK